MTKAFAPAATVAGGTSTLNFTISNPNAGAVTGLNFVDPDVHNGLAGTMLAKDGYFEATGVPVVPIDDAGTWDPYQVAEIVVRDASTGAELARTRATVPVSDEINCTKCHGQVIDDVEIGSVLAAHDDKEATTFVADGLPVNCSDCHGSPILGQTGEGTSEKYLSYAIHSFHYSSEENPKAVYDFLNKIWKPALKVATKEREEMQAMIRSEGKDFKLEAWDWWYYAEKIRKAKYDLDENELRPYFLLDNVRKGAFDVAGKLYGIEFVERKDIPTYSDEVTVFEVKRMDGSHVGILYTDYFPRPGKRAGAWCSSYRRQERVGETFETPLMYNVGNFSRPAGDRPSLLKNSPQEWFRSGQRNRCPDRIVWIVPER